MNRKIDMKIVERWMSKHEAYGIETLAIKANVSASTIAKLKAGRIPCRQTTRILIARALSVSEDELFPPVSAGKEEAS